MGYAVAADLAKRLECAQLAAAFECQTCPNPPPSRRTPNASPLKIRLYLRKRLPGA
ncbi:hypothetical protein SBV1_2620001 [Verrucomicrobia bacterium]|nr:hypothetical protein SBV1_2620001 [Verrucomicrobiota bacterium]